MAGKYQGHRSWNAWNVSMWLTNDYETYLLVCETVDSCKTKDAASRVLYEMLPKTTPDGAKYTLSSIREALTYWNQ